MMKQIPMKHKIRVYSKHLGFWLVMLAVVLSAACGNKLIRGASPMVRMSELSHQDDYITLHLNMRNVNGVPLDIQTINFSLSVDNTELFAYQGPVDINIVANGTETWQEDVVETTTSRELLYSLQNGDVKSLPYVLKGSVTTRDDGSLHFEYDGHIYPLPGRPGHFR
jgi:hypothetical protein